ncbi:GFA family protein [Agaribacterium haliotis]|uniref:GFA family protein n=1 Tax=Agaribacterium haliotis TaxID=2013869 RepID=UPI000BB5850A|nr:GFA family protein [Agaribacterium haliotis]
MLYNGGCHCGKVQFSIEAPEYVEVEDCNCSICEKTGFLHLILPRSKFKLLSGEQYLSCYQFNEKIAKHYFCSVCGIKAFYIPRSNPDGIDVNLRCLEQKPKSVHINKFDGRNWEANAATLAHKSKDA